jgi:GDP-4-dehydro-6-deoxy-D-mannose reductase
VAATARTPQPGFLVCDLTVPGQIESIVASIKPRWIIQCAGATAAVARADMDRLHLGGTAALLDAVIHHIPGAVVTLFGSAAEYGRVPPAALPIKEDNPACPDSAFGQSKLAQLRLAKKMTAEFGLRVLTVRPFHVLGPDVPEHYLAGTLVRRLRERKGNDEYGPFPVSNPFATRDWVDVRDLAEAVVSLVFEAAPSPGVLDLFNIASGKETSILELAGKLCKLAGNLTAVPESEEWSRSDLDRSCGDAGRLQLAVGWHPRISLEESLADVWGGARRQLRQAA